jgi:hypothetical protein
MEGMNRPPYELIEFLGPYPLEIQALALEARLGILELTGPASDLIFDGAATVMAGLAYTGESSDNFVSITVYAEHLTLTFPFGSRLTDPENRLRGDGKLVRNIRLSNMQTLQDPYVIDLIQQASSMAKKPSVPMEPVTYVKVYSGPKRQPR